MGTVSAGRAEGAGRNYPYTPDYAIPPGETLEEALGELGMSQTEFARRTGRPEKTVNEIIKGKTAITPETAFQFERVTGISARLWLNLESDYRASLVQQEEREYLGAHIAWLDRFPYRELVKRGLLANASNPVDRLIEALRFFGVATLETWDSLWADVEVAYRHAATFKSEPKALAAWLRCGEIEAHTIECAPYDKARFLAVLREIRAMTRLGPAESWDRMVELCASAGVALVHTRELPGTHVSGATRWLSPQKAILQVSFRYLTDDQLWFSFFHEAAHLLLHGKRDRFVDAGQGEAGEKDDTEKQADAWAVEFLIPPRAFQSFVALRSFDLASIKAFADSQGVAVGIVAGQLEHRKLIPYSRGAKLKRHYTWAEAEE